MEKLARLDKAGALLTPEEAERLAAYKQRKAEAGLPLTLEESEWLEAHRNRKKAALKDLKARAETDPAAAELAQQRAQQSEVVKKSRQKMYADAAGDPEAQAQYERFLATRRENYHRKKQTEQVRGERSTLA